MVKVFENIKIYVLLPMITLILSGCYHRPTVNFERQMETYDSDNLPFRISICKDIESDGLMSYEKNIIGIVNKSDGSTCSIQQLYPSDVIKTLLYIDAKTIRIIWDKSIVPYHSSEDGGTSNDLKTAFTSEDIDIKFVFRHYFKDASGNLTESITTELNDTSSWKSTIVKNGTTKFVHDEELQKYEYLIAIEEKKDFIWVYDSEGRIVYRSPKLLKFHEEEPYLARRYEQKVL